MSPDRSAQLKKAKRDVRAHVIAERDQMPASLRLELGSRAIERLLGLEEIRAAQRVMAFWSFGSEISTEPLLATLHARGVTICLPRIEDGNLVPRSYTPGDATTTTSFGAREPTATAAPVDPTTIDVVVTPGLAFDRRCRRVGYGGGFFDRFFGHMAPGAFRAGVAFSLQVLDEQLPAGPSDVPVHAVVTEREVVRCAGGGDAT